MGAAVPGRWTGVRRGRGGACPGARLTRAGWRGTVTVGEFWLAGARER